ncbi:MAG: SpoIIE family protein phosphatase [Solidesulfovibrio sp. DCME]|uniref:SpoIIE family protein phosphatase n=1 Tax=Solidesulfovibrio sp. DCME TaxID=3447380 RepID=UPI003D0ABFF3
MRIRWKLFWLLAAISLVPLVLLRINSQFALSRLAEKLSTRVGAHLVAEAQTRLLRLVEDHARLLAARRQALSLAVAMQAAAVQRALENPSPPALAPDTVILVAPEMGMGMRRQLSDDPGLAAAPNYFRLDPDGMVTSLPIDTNRLTLRLLPGPTGAPSRAEALATLLGPYRKVAALTGPLAHFQSTVLADGLAATYPATAGLPRRHDPRQAPWYLAAMALPGPAWTSAQVEPGTGRVCVAASSRVTDSHGTPLGATAIFTPLDDLLATVTSTEHLPGAVESLLVVAMPGPDGGVSLVTQAGEVRPGRGHGWHAYVTPAPLPVAEPAVLAAMATDVAAGTSGVRRLTYQGRDSLAAYAPTVRGEALLQVAPVTDVLAEARAVADDVRDSIERLYLFGTAIVLAVMLALVFLSLSASRAVTRPILALTKAAGRLAEGDFAARVETPGTDEIGDLGRVFNELAPRLDAHLRLCESVGLASQVQRSLLPDHPPDFPGLALAGASRYCDETGGDYFDFLTFDGEKAGVLGVALGDVSGHGLEAALLMTTARALLRPRAAAPGSPGAIMADVNRELTRDVYGTGRFMTLFYLEVDPARGAAAFARGGHDPALRFDPATGRLDELTAKGMALGVAEEARFETGTVTGLTPGQTICIGSDGLWEAENEAGEMFGKARVRDILAQTAINGPQAVLDALFAALDAFRGSRALDDDVTLVILTLTAPPA